MCTEDRKEHLNSSKCGANGDNRKETLKQPRNLAINFRNFKLNHSSSNIATQHQIPEISINSQIVSLPFTALLPKKHNKVTFKTFNVSFLVGCRVFKNLVTQNCYHLVANAIKLCLGKAWKFVGILLFRFRHPLTLILSFFKIKWVRHFGGN